MGFYSTRTIPDSTTLSEWVSRLTVQGKKTVLIELLRDFESTLTDVINVVEHGIPLLYAQFQDGSSMPLSALGDGINKALHILLIILMSPSGIVLIDEIENGFHYSIYTQILKLFYKVAAQQHCQLIITTHSDAILRSSAEAMEELGTLENLAYIRMAYEMGRRNAFNFSGQELKNALDGQMEVR